MASRRPHFSFRVYFMNYSYPRSNSTPSRNRGRDHRRGRASSPRQQPRRSTHLMNEPKGQERTETPKPPARSESPPEVDGVPADSVYDGYRSDVWERLEDWPAGDSLH